MQHDDAALDIYTMRQEAPDTKTSQTHNTARQTPNKTQATGIAQFTHSTLLKSSNWPMDAARRRQGNNFMQGMARPAAGLH